MIESRDVMLFISYSGGAKTGFIIPRLEDKSIALLAMTDRRHRWAGESGLDISVTKPARCTAADLQQ